MKMAAPLNFTQVAIKTARNSFEPHKISRSLSRKKLLVHAKMCKANLSKSAFSWSLGTGPATSLESQKRIIPQQDEDSPRTILSGIQPTGILHLGNYFGTIKRWVDLQQADSNLFYCIVDLHSLTTHRMGETLQTHIFEMAATLFACGVDPRRAVFFQQSSVPVHCELAWILACMTPLSRLQNLPDYKVKSQTREWNNLGLLSYPVLQAADILTYRANEVPVGNDQTKHLELCQDLARRFNHRVGKEVFPVPIQQQGDVPRLKSLTIPQFKMSKTEANPKSRVHLIDGPDTIRDKIRGAVTDSINEVTYDQKTRPGVSNLIDMMAACSGRSVEQVVQGAKGCSVGDFKLQVTDAVVATLRPIQVELDMVRASRDYVQRTMEEGGAQALQAASDTLRLVKRELGLSSGSKHRVDSGEPGVESHSTYIYRKSTI